MLFNDGLLKSEKGYYSEESFNNLAEYERHFFASRRLYLLINYVSTFFKASSISVSRSFLVKSYSVPEPSE